MSVMPHTIESATPQPTRTPLCGATRKPKLRLLHGRDGQHPAAPDLLRGHDAPPPTLRVVDRPARVLLAGADAGRRSALLDELARTLPASTVFEQADAVCEVLEHAPGSRMAFITGDLDDAPAESLLQTLAQRHPGLPVMVMDSPGANAGDYVGARGAALRVQYA
jgi:hypothetical protein